MAGIDSLLAALAVKISANTGEFDTALARSGKRVESFGEQVSRRLQREFETFDDTVKKTGRGIIRFGDELQGAGAAMSVAITAPLTAAAVEAVKTAGSFQQMSNVIQAQGDVSAAQMELVATKARELGADLTLPGTSATDALGAIQELNKGGLELADSMDAAKGTIQLASAAQIANARAAEIQANALAAFNLKASQATKVSDLLTGAANKSSSSIEQVAQGFQAGSAVANMAKLSISQFTTALALMAKAGIKGSDAGTSIKSMLMALLSPSDKAKKLMDQLGISIFDAQGQMKPFEQVIAEFSGTLSGLNDQAKANILGTIFGSDGIRAAQVIFQQGPAGFAAMEKAISKAGSAAKLAEAQNKGLFGAYDGLKSAIETFLEGVATPFLGVLESLTRATASLFEKLNTLPTPVKIVATAMAGFAAAAGPVLFAVGSVIKLVPSLVAGFAAIRTAVLSLNGALAASVVGLAALAAVQITELANAPTDADRNLVEQQRYTEVYKKLSKDRQKAAAEELVAASNNERRTIEQSKRAIQAFQEANAAIRKREGTDGSSLFRFGKTDPAALKTLQDNEKAIASYQAKLGTATERLNVFQARMAGIRDASGEATPAVDALTESLKGLEDLGTGENRIGDLIAGINKALRDADSKAKVFGDTFDLLGEKTGILTNGIGQLIEEGLTPQNREIQRFKDLLDSLSLNAFKQSLEGISLDQLSGVSIKLPEIKFPEMGGNDFGLNALKGVSDAFAIAAEQAKVFGDTFDLNAEKTRILEGAIQNLINNGFAASSPVVQALALQLDALTGAQQRIVDIGPALQQTAQGVADAFIDFGIAALQSGSNTTKLAEGLFTTLGDLLINLGKTALTAGLGIAAIKKALVSLNPVVALAAGAALIGFGTLIKNAVKSVGSGGSGLSGGGGGGGSSSSGPSLPSAPSTQSRTSDVRMSAVSPQTLTVTVTGELVGRGSTLVAVIKEEEKRTNRAGAGKNG